MPGPGTASPWRGGPEEQSPSGKLFFGGRADDAPHGRVFRAVLIQKFKIGTEVFALTPEDFSSGFGLQVEFHNIHRAACAVWPHPEHARHRLQSTAGNAYPFAAAEDAVENSFRLGQKGLFPHITPGADAEDERGLAFEGAPCGENRFMLLRGGAFTRCTAFRKENKAQPANGRFQQAYEGAFACFQKVARQAACLGAQPVGGLFRKPAKVGFEQRVGGKRDARFFLRGKGLFVWGRGAVRGRRIRREFVSSGNEERGKGAFPVAIEKTSPPGQSAIGGGASGRAGVELALGHGIIKDDQGGCLAGSGKGGTRPIENIVLCGG